MGETEPPNMEAVPGAQHTPPAQPLTAAGAPRKRGPKPDHETALRVAEIIATFKHGDRKDKLDEICSALDKAELPYPKTWPRRSHTLLILISKRHGRIPALSVEDHVEGRKFRGVRAAGSTRRADQRHITRI